MTKPGARAHRLPGRRSSSWLRRALAVGLAAGCGSEPAREAPRLAHPNVLVIVADDLGWGDVGYHGGRVPTPHIDRLAGEGIELDRFYAFPVCVPTRAALMTGRSPIVLGQSVGGPGREDLSLDEHLLPESFRAAGYQTALVGKWHLAGPETPPYLPQNRGFDHFYGLVGGGVHYFSHRRRGGGGLDWQRNGAPLLEEGYATDLLAAEAAGWIRARDPGRPFFAVLAFTAVHTPLSAPEERVRKFRHLEGERRQTYAAMIDALDAGIGRVLDALDGAGLAEQTLVLFLSDNGAERARWTDNGLLRGGKGSVFEGGIRVPAALRWPGTLPAGRRTAQRMTVMDVFPTLAEAAGIAPANRRPFDGESLWPELSSGGERERRGIVIATRDAALLEGPWKLVRRRTGPPQLYRVEEDPSEAHDLADQDPERTAALAARLASQLEALRRRFQKTPAQITRRRESPASSASESPSSPR